MGLPTYRWVTHRIYKDEVIKDILGHMTLACLDVMAWYYEHSSMYSTKSAYGLAKRLDEENNGRQFSSSTEGHPMWSTGESQPKSLYSLGLWKTSIPKIRVSQSFF
jgi:hypothetical protein